MPYEPFMPEPGADLYNHAWFPNQAWPEDLAAVAQPENWDDEGSGREPILHNYLRFYSRRVAEEGKWLIATTSSGPEISAFDTGLLSRHFEPIYAVFEANRDSSRQRWVHKEWAAPSSPWLRAFDLASLQPAVFFEHHDEVVFDPRLPVIQNVDHIVNDNVDRYPVELQPNEHLRKATLEYGVKVAAAKARSNWRLAAPQFYWPKNHGAGRIQLLLPLSLVSPDQVDLALVVDRVPPVSDDGSPDLASYRAYTVLPLAWAYRNARLITRPESYWLDRTIREEVGGDVDLSDDGQGRWRPARVNNACPVCGATGRCMIRWDNREALCHETPSTSAIESASGVHLYRHELTWGR